MSKKNFRDKERLRDRESLTIYFTAKFKIEVFYTSIGSRKKTGKAKGWVKKTIWIFPYLGLMDVGIGGCQCWVASVVVAPWRIGSI